MKIATCVYAAFTALGMIFYMLLPDVINLFGANISKVLIYYGGLAAYFGDITSNMARVYFYTGIALLILQMVLLLVSLIKKQYVLLFFVVLTDILLTGTFVLWKGGYPMLIGLLNVLYCIWLGIFALKKQSDTAIKLEISDKENE